MCGVTEKLRNYVVSHYTYVVWDIQEHYNTPISRYLHRQRGTKACGSLNLLDCGRNYYYFLSHHKYFHWPKTGRTCPTWLCLCYHGSHAHFHRNSLQQDIIKTYELSMAAVTRYSTGSRWVRFVVGTSKTLFQKPIHSSWPLFRLCCHCVTFPLRNIYTAALKDLRRQDGLTVYTIYNKRGNKFGAILWILVALLKFNEITWSLTIRIKCLC